MTKQTKCQKVYTSRDGGSTLICTEAKGHKDAHYSDGTYRQMTANELTTGDRFQIKELGLVTVEEALNDQSGQTLLTLRVRKTGRKVYRTIGSHQEVGQGSERVG